MTTWEMDAIILEHACEHEGEPTDYVKLKNRLLAIASEKIVDEYINELKEADKIFNFN